LGKCYWGRILKKASFVFLSIVLVFWVFSSEIAVNVVAGGSGDWPYSGSGDWVINQFTHVYDEEITLNGNLIVNSTLVLENVTIFVNSTSSTNYRIEVTEWGNLTLINSTIKAYNTAYRYHIEIDSGVFYSYGSIIMHTGYVYGQKSGIWVTSQNFKLYNSTVVNSYFGIYVNPGSVIDIENSAIYANYTSSNEGMHIQGSNIRVFIKNSRIESQHYGIRGYHASNIILENSYVYGASKGVYLTNFENFTARNSIIKGITIYGIQADNVANVFLENVNVSCSNNEAVWLNNVTNLTFIKGMANGGTYGLHINNSIQIHLHNMKVSSGNSHGILIDGGSKDINIEYVFIAPKYDSIKIVNSENITARGNDGTTGSYVFYIENSSNIIIEDNNGTTDYFTYVANSENITFENNLGYSFKTSYYIKESNNIIIRNNTIISDKFGIYMFNNSNFEISDNEFYTYLGNVTYLYADNITNISILNNIVFGSGTAFSMSRVTNLLFRNNSITVTIYGLEIFNICNNVSIENNTIVAEWTLKLVTVKVGNVNNNKFFSTGISVEIRNSTLLEFSNNIIQSEENHGLYVVSNSTNNVFHNNTFAYSALYGAYLTDDTSGNLFYYNFFIENNQNRTQAVDVSGLNYWNITGVGNYYCDYSGIDFDGDGIGDFPYIIGYSLDYYPIVIDDDGDGLNDFSEIIKFKTSAVRNDTDGDGLLDGFELFYSYTDPNNNDTDNDGLPDGWEYFHGFDPKNSTDAGLDFDNDGLSNLYEYLNGTDPWNSDTDSDGMDDYFEVIHRLNPLHNDADLDPDNDGLTNLEEYTIGTNPLDSDSDDDGMPDGWEHDNNLDPTTNDASLDPDSDNLSNYDEYTHGTDPHNNDTDSDNIPDGWEVENGLDPLTNDSMSDIDNDGLTNYQEYSLSTNPAVNDTDGDGLSDGDEVNVYGTNPLSSDSDNDGLSDYTEVKKGTDPNDPDTDNDGITDSKDSLPTTNDYLIYSLIGFGVIAIAGLFVYFKKIRK